MSLDPEKAEGIPRKLIGMYSDAELSLLGMMADAVTKGIEADDWYTKQQGEAGRFRNAAQRLAASLSKAAPTVVRDVVTDAVKFGADAVDADIDLAGHLAAKSGNPAGLQATISIGDKAASLTRRAGADGLGALATVNQTLPGAASKLYQQVTSRVNASQASSELTRRQAVQQALDVLTARGITGFRDRAGKNWSLSTYVEMKSRTLVNNTLMESHIDRMLDRGLDLVVVSSHRNPAPNCQPFEGQVLSIGEEQPGTIQRPNATGGAPVTVRVKATMDEARAQGFRHPNCRHSVAAFIPGASRTFTTEPDVEGYKATQQLRAMERAIRETKRRQAVAIEPSAKRALATKLRTQQSTLKQHIDANDLKRRSLRERPDLGYRINPPDDLRGTTPKPAPVPPKPASTFLSPSTRDLVDNARSTLPKTRADWLDTTLRYPTDKNGAKLVPEKLQRHLDTTLNVGKAIRSDAVKRIGTDSTIKALHAEEKKLVDSAQWLSPRRAEIQREIVRREQSIIREALNEVRPFGGVQQAARLKAVADGRVSPGTQAALTQLRSAEAFFPADWLRAASARGELTVGTASRAFFQAGSDGDLLAAASTDELPAYRGAFTDYPEEVMVHELGHRMEQSINGLTQLEYALVRSRSIDSDGVLEPVTKIYDEPGSEHEVGYEDRWKSKYAGKTYATDAAADPARSSMEAFQVGLQDTLGRGHRGGEFDESGQLQEFVIGVLALL